jgi:predicted TIM-barrel fold metal-dependent hydrolase
VPSVPDAFLANYRIPTWMGNLLRSALHKRPLRKALLFIMKYAPIKVDGLQLRRYLALVEISLNKYQSDVFDDLMANYSSDARFVVLTMNFDYMTGEVPESNYNHYVTQLHEALSVKEMYGDKILPFLFIDPRMGRQRCMKLVEHYFDVRNPRGVAGIKLYPALGYYPCHPDLEPVYAFAEQHQIPIITHAYKGGGGYYTGKFTPGLMSYHSFNPTEASKNFLNKYLEPFNPKMSGRDFANIFLHPILYTDVLEKFKNLKICFAHFGGDKEIVNQGGSDQENWTDQIKSFIRQYDHVYTDVSYSLAFKKANEQILKDMNDPKFSTRILFGTDYFLTSVQAGDEKLTKGFFETLKGHEQTLTETNPRAFLKSTFFTP